MEFYNKVISNRSLVTDLARMTITQAYRTFRCVSRAQNWRYLKLQIIANLKYAERQGGNRRSDDFQVRQTVTLEKGTTRALCQRPCGWGREATCCAFFVDRCCQCDST